MTGLQEVVNDFGEKNGERRGLESLPPAAGSSTPAAVITSASSSAIGQRKLKVQRSDERPGPEPRVLFPEPELMTDHDMQDKNSKPDWMISLERTMDNQTRTLKRVIDAHCKRLGDIERTMKKTAEDTNIKFGDVNERMAALREIGVAGDGCQLGPVLGRGEHMTKSDGEAGAEGAGDEKEVWDLLSWNMKGGKAIAAVKNFRVRPAVLMMQEARGPKGSQWTSCGGYFMVHAPMEGRVKGCVIGLQNDVIKLKRLEVVRAELNLVAADVIEANGTKMRWRCIYIHQRGKFYDPERAAEALDFMNTCDVGDGDYRPNEAGMTIDDGVRRHAEAAGLAREPWHQGRKRGQQEQPHRDAPAAGARHLGAVRHRELEDEMLLAHEHQLITPSTTSSRSPSGSAAATQLCHGARPAPPTTCR